MTSKRIVSDIKARLFRPALTSHFEVQIGIPGGGFNQFLTDNGIPNFLNSDNQTTLNLMCSEATLPGSNLATLDINNDFHGVTERHAYRRIYDDRIDLTFYVDATNYLPIRFFETWIKYIVDESRSEQPDKGRRGSLDRSYFYRVRYPEGSGPEGRDGYVSEGLKVIKFERDYSQRLEYRFVSSFPISINSIPVSYDSSSLLKCTVSMTYIRYVLIESEQIRQQTKKTDPSGQSTANGVPRSPFDITPERQAQLNAAFSQNFNLGNLSSGTLTNTNFNPPALF
jgi:hypothetical protein